jgi:hypothetical protein
MYQEQYPALERFTERAGLQAILLVHVLLSRKENIQSRVGWSESLGTHDHILLSQT